MIRYGREGRYGQGNITTFTKGSGLVYLSGLTLATAAAAKRFENHERAVSERLDAVASLCATGGWVVVALNLFFGIGNT